MFDWFKSKKVKTEKEITDKTKETHKNRLTKN